MAGVSSFEGRMRFKEYGTTSTSRNKRWRANRVLRELAQGKSAHAESHAKITKVRKGQIHKTGSTIKNHAVVETVIEVECRPAIDPLEPNP
jgi:hypothetical protein